MIVVNGESSPIDYNYPIVIIMLGMLLVTPGFVYTWSATIETCGGGQTIGGEYTSPIPGCTDSTALNYDALATFYDGSCEYLGCMDTLLNYNDQATDDNYEDVLISQLVIIILPQTLMTGLVNMHQKVMIVKEMRCVIMQQ